MPRTSYNIRIPLSEGEAVTLLGRVKPTADMPRPGASKKANPPLRSKTEPPRLGDKRKVPPVPPQKDSAPGPQLGRRSPLSKPPGKKR